MSINGSPLKVMHLFAPYAAIHDDLPINKYGIPVGCTTGMNPLREEF